MSNLNMQEWKFMDEDRMNDEMYGYNVSRLQITIISIIFFIILILFLIYGRKVMRTNKKNEVSKRKRNNEVEIEIYTLEDFENLQDIDELSILL